MHEQKNRYARTSMINYIKKKNTITFLTALLFSLNIVCMESFIPTSIGGYSIKAPKQNVIDNDNNTIISKLQNDCPDGILHILNQILQSDNDNNNIRGSIACIYNDFGMNSSIEFFQLINSLAHKTNHVSSEILIFVDEQRKIYQNTDKTSAFFKAFDDATKVYYFLFNIQTKVKNNQSLTQQEYNGLLKNVHLIDWKFSYNQLAVARPFFNRFHDALNVCGGYIKCSATSSAFFSLFLIDHLKFNDTLGGGSALVLSTVYALATFIIVKLHANRTVPQTHILTLPTPKVLSLEDMTTIIEHTPWLE